LLTEPRNTDPQAGRQTSQAEHVRQSYRWWKRAWWTPPALRPKPNALVRTMPSTRARSTARNSMPKHTATGKQAEINLPLEQYQVGPRQRSTDLQISKHVPKRTQHSYPSPNRHRDPLSLTAGRHGKPSEQPESAWPALARLRSGHLQPVLGSQVEQRVLARA
jgi:hypothetical protein